MRYVETPTAVLADGLVVAVPRSPDRYAIAPDEWWFADDGLLDILRAGVGTTEWMHATRGADDVWHAVTPSGRFELRRRTDVHAEAFDLTGVVAFGRVEPGPSLLVPPQMPVPEALFALWAATRIVRLTAAGSTAALAATTAVTAANTVNAVNISMMSTRF